MNSRTNASPQPGCSRRNRCSRRRAPSSVRSSASRKPWEGERGMQQFYQDSKVQLPVATAPARDGRLRPDCRNRERCEPIAKGQRELSEVNHDAVDEQVAEAIAQVGKPPEVDLVDVAGRLHLNGDHPAIA